MSFFNLLFGSNPSMEAAVKTALGNVGRYRAAWIEKGDGGVPVLAVYTRNGGGNREHYGDGDGGLGCDCTGCIISHRLPSLPLYIGDRDDDFDCTYCTVYFRLPAEFEQALDAGDPKWRDTVQESVNMSDEWLKKLAQLKEHKS